MSDIKQYFFGLVGGSQNEVTAQAEPALIVVNGKLVQATGMVQPKLVLNGPKTPAQAGELVVVEASLTGEQPQFVQKPAKITWSVSDQGEPKQYWVQGKSVIFGAGVKSTSIDVSAKLVLNYLVEGKLVQKTVIASTSVPVGEITPVDPKTGGVKDMVAEWAKDPKIVTPDANTKTAMRALSRNFKILAGEIGDPGLVTLKDVLVKTRETNNAALTNVYVDPKHWEGWGKNLQEFLSKEFAAKRLNTPEQIKKVWWEISAGLWVKE